MPARSMILTLILGGALLAGCAARHSGEASAVDQPRSILAASTPAPGTTVQGPVDELRLHFSPPARLDEVTVASAAGLMPAMIHSVGESSDYSIPLSGLEAGAYTVKWRATARGRAYEGSFGFTVR